MYQLLYAVSSVFVALKKSDYLILKLSLISKLQTSET